MTFRKWLRWKFRVFCSTFTTLFWRTVNAFRRAWRAAVDGQTNLVTFEELMAVTTELVEHPEEWHHPCNCELCRSYG